jgi:predicted lipoprotein with Yx(FWY)xxD motif
MRAHRNALRSALLAAGAGAALLTAGCSAPAPAAGPSLLSGSIGGNAVAFLQPHKTLSSGTVLANGTGYTLYWFSRDTPAYTACDDTCLPQWPPVTGMPKARAGTVLAGRFGTLRRADGAVQATYDGHPLYTFAGDFDPGDVGGNGVVQFGGTWHVVRPG